MEKMVERNKIESLLSKERPEIRNQVIKNIENFKEFSGLELISGNLSYIVFNELEKVLKNNK